jgi:hypothetical protein
LPRKRMTAEALGQLGEAELRRMAAQGGFVANAASRDILGFDYVVEIQTLVLAAPASDLESQGQRAFFQIKATQGRPRSISIKLSNWQRMVNDPSPWFVVVFEIDEDAQVDSIYVVHIDEHLIREGLLALRAASKPLNTIRKRVRYHDCNRLPNSHGSELAARISSDIGRDAWAYQTAKRELFESCGYEDYPHVAEVSLPQQPRTELIQAWTRIALGHDGALQFEGLKVFDNRFGIKKLISSASAGTVTWTPASVRGTLVVEVRESSEWVSAPAAIYSTSVIPGFPAAAARMRVVLGPLSLEIPAPLRSNGAPLTRQGTVTWDASAPHSVRAMALAAKVTRLMQQPGVSLTVAIADAPSHSLTMSLSGFAIQGASEMLELEHAGVVTERVNLQHVEVSSDSLVAQRPRFSAMSAICRGEFGDFRMAFPAPEREFAAECAMINVMTASLGEWGIVICYAVIVRPLKEDGMLVFKNGRIRLGGLWPVRISEASDFPLSQKIAALHLEVERAESIDTVFRPSKTSLGLDES